MLLRASCPFCGRKNKPGARECVKCKKRIRINSNEDRWSEHGLGHLLNPIDPESDDRDWIAQIWRNIILRALRRTTRPLGFEDSPAVGRITISSPAVFKPLANLNSGKLYADRIKPFNFLITAHVCPLGHPPAVDPERFHLIRPYEPDSRKWMQEDWIDQYSGKTFRITTNSNCQGRTTCRVKTYGDVVTEYEFHPEPKCADINGEPCGKQTVALLQRRHIRVDRIKYIGKESNLLEEVGQGLIHSEGTIYTVYPDPRRDEWQTKLLPALKEIPLNFLVESCMGRVSRRALIDLRAGRSRPHRRNQELLTSIVRRSQRREYAVQESGR